MWLIGFPCRFTRNFNHLKETYKLLLSVMSSSEAIKRIESRAAVAKELVTTLEKEIAAVKEAQSKPRWNERKQILQAENEKLNVEIEKWKNRLIKLEIQNGIKQVPVPVQNKPTGTQAGPPLAPHILPVSKETPSCRKPENAGETSEKKKKDKPTDGKKAKGGSSGNAPNSTTDEPPVDVGRLDFRVGCIVSAKKHPDADSLYVEDVDVGEEKTRTVVSGLVKFVPIEEMQGRMAILLCNLKPAKMRGVMSEAMVMCASTPEKVEILSPPPGSVPGDLVHIDGYPRLPDSVLNPKKKVFETVAPDLKTNSEKVATYKETAWTVPGKGSVTTASLVGVQIK